MCGIVGMVAKENGGFNRNQEALSEEMLYADALRGMDSTGAFLITRKKQIQIVKQGSNPGIFLKTPEWYKFKSDVYGKASIFVGHNRKATTGEISTKNAHPFLSKGDGKRIVLVHNGYIQNSTHLDKEVEVDSESILTVLQEEKDPTKAINRLFGAWAIVWYNQNTNKLYLARNGLRPLYISHSNMCMYFASEGPMLSWLLPRNEISSTEPYLIPENKLIEISVDPYHFNVVNIPSCSVSVLHRTRTEHLDMRQPFESESGRPDEYEDSHHTELVKTTLPSGGEWTERIRNLEALKAQNREKSVASIFADSPNDPLPKKIETLTKLYPKGTTVLFRSIGFTEDSDGVMVKGYIWTPNKDPKPAVIRIDKSKDDECYIDHTESKPPLIGLVRGYASRNNQAFVVLSSIERDASGTVKCINDTMLSFQEWQMIVDQRGCDECSKPPHRLRPDDSEVVRLGIDTYHITCHECVEKATQPVRTGTEQ